MNDHDAHETRAAGWPAASADGAEPGTAAQAAKAWDPTRAPSRARPGPEQVGRWLGDAPGSQRPRVVWARPTELASAAAARLAGRGIDFQAELARRVRGAAARTAGPHKRSSSRRALRLPPVEAFGARRRDPATAARRGFGRP